jgi:hypothetical protein
MKLIQTCTAFAIVGIFFTAPMAAIAQQAQPPASRPSDKKPEPVTGEILSINTSTKTLIVKTAEQTEMKFTYSEETVIVGADKGAEGLTGKPGAVVTVTYDIHGTANIALRIEVQPKK